MNQFLMFIMTTAVAMTSVVGGDWSVPLAGNTFLIGQRQFYHLGLKNTGSLRKKQIIGWHVFEEGVSRSDWKLLTNFHTLM